MLCKHGVAGSNPTTSTEFTFQVILGGFFVSIGASGRQEPDVKGKTGNTLFVIISNEFRENMG